MTRATDPPGRIDPLNCASTSEEEVGRLASNFAHTPFVFRGVEYASLEGFYQSMKFPHDEARRAMVAGLHGVHARSAGKKAKTKTSLLDGESFELGSERHHEIMKQAIRVKFEQHPDIARAFVATRPRPIVRDTGRPARRSPFTAHVFCRILEELREDFAERLAERG